VVGTVENQPAIFIAEEQTQRWRFTWNKGEWHGDTINPPRPLSNRARLTYAMGPITAHSNGTFSVLFSVTNHGPGGAFFKLEPTSY